MKEAVTILRAANAAARWHVTQKRKGASREPYINHLLEVALLVAAATDGRDPDLIVAALLHDAIEDQGVPYEIIANNFGDGVAKLVEEVTDDMGLDKQERQRLQVELASAKSDRAKILKLADKISNVRAVAESPAPEWSVKRRLEYVAWSQDVAAGLRGVVPTLEEEFERTVEAAVAAITSKTRP